ncbi:Uncharacterized protein HZ326_0160 [Fusarium oxysporum f. sp. albedinis]|nr:Uncharacterized protein HZ326_0160 [Fusarium oxysporum f. sp. albedinis]
MAWDKRGLRSASQTPKTGKAAAIHSGRLSTRQIARSDVRDEEIDGVKGRIEYGAIASASLAQQRSSFNITIVDNRQHASIISPGNVQLYKNGSWVCRFRGLDL